MDGLSHGPSTPLAPWRREEAPGNGFEVPPAQLGHPTDLHGLEPALGDPPASSRLADSEQPGAFLDRQRCVHVISLVLRVEPIWARQRAAAAHMTWTGAGD